MFCSRCGRGIPEKKARFCPSCGQPVTIEGPAFGREQCQRSSTFPSQSFSSPQLNATSPPGVVGWNWGAFLLPIFWAASHNLWGWALGIFFGSCIPVLGFLIAFGGPIFLALKGNELAWNARKFDSVEQFQGVQKIWARWSIVIFVTFAGLLTAFMMLFFAIIAAGGGY